MARHVLPAPRQRTHLQMRIAKEQPNLSVDRGQSPVAKDAGRRLLQLTTSINRTLHPCHPAPAIYFTSSIILRLRSIFSARRSLRKLRKLEKSSNIFKSLQYFQISAGSGRSATRCSILQRLGVLRLVAVTPWATQLASPRFIGGLRQ
jgi:hypothetical protein